MYPLASCSNVALCVGLLVVLTEVVPINVRAERILKISFYNIMAIISCNGSNNVLDVFIINWIVYIFQLLLYIFVLIQ